MTPESTRGHPGEWTAGESDVSPGLVPEAEGAPERTLGAAIGRGVPRDGPGDGKRRALSGGRASGRAQPAGRRLRGFCVRMLLGGLIAISRALPMPWAERLGSALGDLLFRCVPRYRAVARRNLAAAFGWEAAQVETVARQ